MITYVETTGADKVISTSAAYLERIIVGKSVGSSVIEISNSPSDGDGDIKVYLAGDTLVGEYAIGAEFNKGICADLTNQTNVSFVWAPMAA